MSSWVHDGRRWTAAGDEPISGLPLRGRLRLTRGNTGVRLEINGRAFAGEPLSGILTHGGRLGVRWRGAIISPLGTEEQPLRLESQEPLDS